MKKYVKYIPHLIFAIAMIFIGAIGKLTGAAPAVSMFEQIDVFGLGEAFGRIMVGLAELFAGVGIFFALTRKIAAVIGIAVMAAAIALQVMFIGGSLVLPIVIMIIGIIILFQGDCKKCANGTCKDGTCCKKTVCNGETCDLKKSE